MFIQWEEQLWLVQKLCYLYNYKAVSLKKKNLKLRDQTWNMQSWHISVTYVHGRVSYAIQIWKKVAKKLKRDSSKLQKNAWKLACFCKRSIFVPNGTTTPVLWRKREILKLFDLLPVRSWALRKCRPGSRLECKCCIATVQGAFPHPCTLTHLWITWRLGDQYFLL